MNCHTTKSGQNSSGSSLTEMAGCSSPFSSNLSIKRRSAGLAQAAIAQWRRALLVLQSTTSANPEGDLTELVNGSIGPKASTTGRRPRKSSLIAVGQIVQITGLKAIVFYKPTPEEEHVKIEITP